MQSKVPYIPIAKARGFTARMISQYAEVLAEIFAKRLRYKKAYEYLEIANNARKKLNGVVIEL